MNSIQSNRLWTILIVVGAVTAIAWSFANRGPSPESIAEGKKIFEHVWTENDPLAGGDGLGPVFNARSCAECHFQGGVGGGGTNDRNVTAFEVLPGPNQTDNRVRGGVLHAFASAPELLETKASVSDLFPIIPNVVVRIEGCSREPTDIDPVRYASINTPPLFGLKLIDDLNGYYLHAAGAKRSINQTISAMDNRFKHIPVGRLRVLGGRIGRFGWKGQFASLEDFVAAACAVELGLSNPKRRQDRPQRHAEDKDAARDLDHKQFRALVDFVRSLPQPKQVMPADAIAAKKVEEGGKMFARIGCAECHTPDLGPVKGVYSDFRLYSLEDAAYSQVPLEANAPDDHPRQAEWKTPPLWGVADSAPYFHDGGSTTLTDAILRHDGDGQRAKKAFEMAPEFERAQLLAFLKSLRAPAAAEAKNY